MEDAGDAEALKFWNQTERGEFTLWTGHQDGRAHAGVDGVCEVMSDDDGWRGLALCIQRCDTAHGDGREQVADGAFLRGYDALDESSTRASAVRDEHLLVEAGRHCFDMGQLLQPGSQATPVANAIAGYAHELHMRS